MKGKRRQPLLVRLLRPTWAKCNDFALGIATRESAAPKPGDEPGSEPKLRPKYDDNDPYEVPDYWYVRKLSRMLKAGPEDVIYDVGCGMGRFLCVMAREKVRRCVGVELQPQLCEIARRNARRLRGRKAPVDIVCADAATAQLSEGTIYYMYNPFGPETLREVLANLRRSLSAQPRKVTIVYYNALHESLFRAEPWLHKYDEFKTHSGMTVSFWRGGATASNSLQRQEPEAAGLRSAAGA
jgi:SAM-dependent methyltransferase